MTPRRVLLADDFVELRAMLRIALERTGNYTVIAEAGNGREAVELAALHLPDLVVLDLAMPIVDGLEALPAIIAVAPATKVLVLSGLEASRVADVAIEHGASGFVEKDGLPDALITALDALVDA